MTDKESTPTTNRGFIVDLIFNFPQNGVADKESYVRELIEHMHQSFEADKTEIDFDTWLKSPKKK